MCGIAGVVLSPSRAGTDVRACLAAAQEAMVHRGPDDSGLYVTADGRAGLATCRLAIRDLSPAGHMPMANEAGTVWITYNGEIYNADELRSELQRLGYAFRSRSDTEVILHGYAAWGADVVHRLRGMFAFGIMTVEPSGGAVHRLFLARDRLGIKPLYYAEAQGALLFASEVRALQQIGLVGREVSPVGLVGYLLFGAVPGPWTIFRDVRALPRATTLTWENGHAEQRRYWAMPHGAPVQCSYADAVQQVRALLEDAVSAHLVSDVPLGAFLSGGLDSSAVVALMRRATSGVIRTCSMVFEEPAYNEAPYARAMAEAVGAEHCERVVTAGDVLLELDSVLQAMDQPTVDGVNTYFVSKTAREAGLTVALSGLGGDEVFGGYPNTFHGVPLAARGLRWAQQVPGGAFAARKSVEWLVPGHSWSRMADALARPASLASAYVARRGLFAPSEVRALVGPEVWQAARQALDPVAYVAERADDAGDAFQWVSRAELATYTHNQLLRDTDVMSMAHSLEVRVPLLDHRLVELVLSLPAAVRQAGRGPKALLADAVGDRLPPIVRQRKGKAGFVFPFGSWLRDVLQKGRLGAFFDRAASAVTADGMLRPDQVAKVVRTYQAGKTHWSRAWALAVYSLWLDQVVSHLVDLG
ncbi:MAG: asparagine synthase (glutamine-hydrolyzing) [Chloroflexi bacterium]|nr:asparagine synthase (glutamine-hydrolyzing) [Chloroflexota bacterium]